MKRALVHRYRTHVRMTDMFGCERGQARLSRPLTSLALPLVAVLLSLTTVAAAQPGFISTVAGTGTQGFNGDGIPAITAELSRPRSIFVDGSGNLFIADRQNKRIRKVDAATGIISTVAGTGVGGFNGDGIPATAAQLSDPTAVFVDGSRNLFIADGGNHRIRKVNAATGIISTVAGTGPSGFNGDGIPATTAQLNTPTDAFVDGFGNLFIGDGANFRVRKVEPGAVADTDGDGVADDDDLCSGTPSGDAVDANGCSDAQVDVDGDGICDPGAASNGPSACTGIDNCLFDANADQADLDDDGIGNVCDASVNVNGAIDVLIDDFIVLLDGAGLETAFVSRLENILASFESGNEGAAVNELNAIINIVEAQRSKAFTDAEASDLISIVQAIIDAINSGAAE